MLFNMYLNKIKQLYYQTNNNVKIKKNVTVESTVEISRN